MNEISTRVGVSNSYFSKMVRNNANIGSNIVEKILRIYDDINPTWFILGDGDMLKTKSTENATLQKEQNKTKSTENTTLQKCSKKGSILDKNEKYKKNNNADLFQYDYIPEYYKEINSQNITLLTKDIKELSAENALLKKENEELRAENILLKAENAQLQGKTGENKETLSNAG